MQSRALGFAVIITAVTAIAVTALPWFNLNSFGLQAHWNGLGLGNISHDELDVAPNGRGWLIVGASAFAILAALAAFLTAPSARPIARLMAGLAAIGATAASLVPIAIMIWPSWYFGSFQQDLGMTNIPLEVSNVILVALIVILLVLAVLCAALFVERTEDHPIGERPARPSKI
ncbi:MAG: hypothetical protein WBG39_08180 [Gordonia sp. (in: high G+C Gram-positive bacteria)]